MAEQGSLRAARHEPRGVSAGRYRQLGSCFRKWGEIFGDGTNSSGFSVDEGYGIRGRDDQGMQVTIRGKCISYRCGQGERPCVRLGPGIVERENAAPEKYAKFGPGNSVGNVDGTIVRGCDDPGEEAILAVVRAQTLRQDCHQLAEPLPA